MTDRAFIRRVTIVLGIGALAGRGPLCAVRSHSRGTRDEGLGAANQGRDIDERATGSGCVRRRHHRGPCSDCLPVRPPDQRSANFAGYKLTTGSRTGFQDCPACQSRQRILFRDADRQCGLLGTTIFGAAGALIIVLVGGIYFAVNPELYRNGFLMLFPEPWRSHIESTMDDAGAALRLWLSGQLLAMRAVGVMISVGLILVGVPSPLALGVVAGGLEFIPFIGPVLGAIPALLLASSQDWHTVTWTALVFFVVQQIENNLLMPLAGSPGYARRCLFTRPRGRGAAPACVSSCRPRGRCRAGRTPLRSSSAASSASRTGRRERPSRRSW